MGAELLGSRAIRGFISQSLINATPDPWIPPLGTLFDSNQASETYKWLSEVPALRLWKGKRNVSDFVDYGITVVNEKFETTIGFDVDELERDKTQQTKIRIGDVGRRSQTHWSKLATEIIVANGQAYDGKPFFSTTHEELKSGVQSNDFTFDVAAPSTPTAAEMKSAILASIRKMLKYKDGQKEPVADDARSFMVMVPVEHWDSAIAANNNAVIVESGGAVTNTLANLPGFTVTIVTNARLDATDTFYTFRTDTPIPTIIRQEETKPRITMKAEGSEFEHDYDRHEYGVKVKRAVAPGRWQNASRTVLN